MRKNGVPKATIRYSEAFKVSVVRELEREGEAFEAVRRKYGIGGCDTVQTWVRKYGNGTRGKVIRVEKPEEINELKRLRERVRRLESALADASLDLKIERAYVQIACEEAGIKDVEAFKKTALAGWARGCRTQRRKGQREGTLPTVGVLDPDVLRWPPAKATPEGG